MPTQYPDLFAKLTAPFTGQDVRVRKQAGRDLHYITARVAMNRLDEVLGPEAWWDEYQQGEHSVLCKLTIRLPDGSTLTKADAGGYAGMSDQGDDDKSGFSDAFKRAAVKFGVGRHLYKDGVVFYESRELSVVPGRPPEPEPARPAPVNLISGRRQQEHDNRKRQHDGQPPGNGRALFAWAKTRDEKQPGFLRTMNDWAKSQNYPGRMVDWDESKVAAVYAYAMSLDVRQPGDDNPDA